MDISTCPYCGSENYPNAPRCVTCQSEINQTPQPEVNQTPVSTAPRFNASRPAATNRPPIRPLRYDSPETRFEADAKRLTKIFKVFLLLGLLGALGLIWASHFSIDEVSGLSTFDQYYYRVKPPTKAEIRDAVLKQETRKATDTTWSTMDKVLYPVAVDSFDLESPILTTDAKGSTVYSAKYKAYITYETHVRKGTLGSLVKDEDADDIHTPSEFSLMLVWNRNLKKWEQARLEKK